MAERPPSIRRPLAEIVPSPDRTLRRPLQPIVRRLDRKIVRDRKIGQLPILKTVRRPGPKIVLDRRIVLLRNPRPVLPEDRRINPDPATLPRLKPDRKMPRVRPKAGLAAVVCRKRILPRHMAHLLRLRAAANILTIADTRIITKMEQNFLT
jgi:hypothetical protein